MAFILALGASLLIIEPVSPTPNIEVGDIAQRDIQAPRSFQYSDPEHKQNSKGSLARVRPVYTLLGITAEQEQIQIKRVFNKHGIWPKIFPHPKHNLHHKIPHRKEHLPPIQIQRMILLYQ